jgi:hypothetical protein
MNIPELTIFLLLLALMAFVAIVICHDDNDPRFP